MNRAPLLSWFLGSAAASVLLAAAAPAHAQTPPADDADVEVGVKPPSSPPTSTPPAPAATAHGTPQPLIPPAPVSTASPSDVQELQRQLAAAQARIARLEALQEHTDPSWQHRLLPSGLELSGYIQSQYESHQDSQDEIVGGTYLNQDRFLVKRGRIRFDGAWEYAELTLEPDLNTTNGSTFAIRRAEATLVFRNGPFDGNVVRHGPREAAPPLAAVTLGVTDIPFGFELLDSPRERFFMERSTGSLALFPSEAEVAARIWGGAGFFRYQLELANGEPLVVSASKLPGGNPTAAKDFVARLGADAHPFDATRLQGGVSVLRGKGFHAGTDATKNGLVWTDQNEDGIVQPTELAAAPGQAATASVPFDRWAVGADLEITQKTWLGTTMLYGEFTIASNLDRGLVPADPTATQIDVRELSGYGALTQEITRYGVLGFRLDVYDPNADFLDSRRGQLLPTSQRVLTLSPLVGLVLPGRARLLFQYDFVRDAFARDARGVPTDLANDRWTVRLQVQM